ncbi:hypothetical protein GGF32_005572 [Allomyces javanicus]|nr:hypothetical protein GGF32_005572 [Allomyces javanicus]
MCVAGRWGTWYARLAWKVGIRDLAVGKNDVAGHPTPLGAWQVQSSKPATPKPVDVEMQNLQCQLEDDAYGRFMLGDPFMGSKPNTWFHDSDTDWDKALMTSSGVEICMTGSALSIYQAEGA